MDDGYWTGAGVQGMDLIEMDLDDRRCAVALGKTCSSSVQHPTNRFC